jgi:hypothetical protein
MKPKSHKEKFSRIHARVRSIIKKKVIWSMEDEWQIL